jgi:hypothetical protein
LLPGNGFRNDKRNMYKMFSSSEVAGFISPPPPPLHTQTKKKASFRSAVAPVSKFTGRDKRRVLGTGAANIYTPYMYSHRNAVSMLQKEHVILKRSKHKTQAS